MIHLTHSISTPVLLWTLTDDDDPMPAETAPVPITALEGILRG